MTLSGKSSYRLEVHSDNQAFHRLAEAWNDLTDRDKDCTVFQTWTWVSHMWDLEVQAANVSLYLVAVFGEQDRLCAVAPMLLERRFGPLNVRVLRFIGHRLSGRQDIIVGSDTDEDAVIGFLGEWFSSAPTFCDMVVLANISENSRVARHWNILLSRQRFANGCMQLAEEYFYIPVVGTWEEYCAGLKKSIRHSIRRRKRGLESGHAVTFWTEDGSVDAHKSIANFVALHQLRQESKKERGLFRTSTRKRVFSSLYYAMIKEGKMKLFFIDVDGSPKAVQAVLEFNGRSHWYNVGLDTRPSILRLGLGKLLCFVALEDAFETRKTEVDLGGGTQAYKGDFTCHVRRTYQVVEFYSPMKVLPYRMHQKMLGKVQHSHWMRDLYFLVKKYLTRDKLSGELPPR